MVTSGFHLWQFQVFNSGAKGMVLVLFWLDLWEIFFYPTPSFELGTCGSLVLHSTTTPWWLLIFTSDNFRYLTLVQREWCWYCSDWTCERFSFNPHQVLNWGPLNLFPCTLPLHHGDFWFSPLTISTILLWCWGITGGIVLISPMRDFLSIPTLGFELGTSGSLVLHSSTAAWWLLVFTSDSLRDLNLVQRDWCWYCSDWTYEGFLFACTRVSTGTCGSLVMHSTTAPR